MGSSVYRGRRSATRAWRLFLNDQRISSRYRADAAFVSRTGIRSNSVTFGYEFQGDNMWWVRVRPFGVAKLGRTPERLIDESFVARVCLKIGPARHVSVNGRDVVYPEDAICVREPGCIWSTASTGRVGFLAIDIDASLLPSGISRGEMRFAARKVLPDLRGLVRGLRGPQSPEQRPELVASLVLALARSGLIDADELRPCAPVGVSRRVRSALESAIAHPPPLADLAVDNRISRFALLRQFRRDFGITPHAFVLRLRVDRARERLARGDDLAGIALDLGFADQPHFTRVFSSIVGVVPGHYARQVRQVVQVG